MSEKLIQIQKIITLDDYVSDFKEFEHLFEVQLPPNDINLWKIRYNFEMGTPLIGDLVLDIEKENTLEFHPFPEWVVFLKSIKNVNSKPYLIVPHLPKSLIKKISRKSIGKKIELIQSSLINITIDELMAFEYDIGINVLVPPYIPHFFISSKINKEAGEAPPYLQVFEPNMNSIIKNLRIKPTYFFKLPFSVCI